MSGTSGGLSPVKQALLEIRRLRQRLDQMERARTEPIAIVGTGIRFPGGATDADHFHEQLCAGLDAIVEVPSDRWDADRYFDEDRDAAGTMYTRHGGFLNDVAGFDPEFFGISPVEAATIDPQQRLLLEVCWEALEDAGIAASSLRGSRTGVYLGIAAGDYGRMSLADVETVDEYASLGTAFSVAAGRISYVLGLHGPAVSIDTACSASLVALHHACQALRNGECDAALAAGVNLILAPEITINFCRAGMLAADGRCKTFDAAADGYVRSEGCAVVVLRRLQDAQRDGDRILGVIRGSAINQDGRSSGLTAPNGPAQEAVIRTALVNAGLEPRQIGYVEAHGTGTSLGDPIELQALGAVFGADRPEGRPLLVGSVKTNVGHLEAAAGMAGLIKTMQALRHGVIPPHRNFTTPNPHFSWGGVPLAVPAAITPFEPIDGSRRAGLSSFGFSGTNVHVILEEPPRDADAAPVTLQRPLDLLALSAPVPEALRELATRYSARPTAGNDAFSDICHTANTGRSHFRHRLTVQASDTASAATSLRDWLAGVQTSAVQSGDSPHAGATGAALFIDSAAPVAATAWTLRQTAPRFAEVLQRCDAALRLLLPSGLLEMLDPSSEHHGLLQQPEYAQPAAFSVQLALAALWDDWGIRPDILVSSGAGDIGAACHAGIFSLDDAMRLVVLRGRLARDSRALEQAARALRTMTLNAPAHVQIVSARLGRAVSSAELMRAEYWLDSMQRAGDAAAGIAAARAEGACWLLCVGVGSSTGQPEGLEVTAPAPVAGADPWVALLAGLGRLYTAGLDVRWRAVSGSLRRRVDLPRYPFQRRRYWLPSRESAPQLDSRARMDIVQRATVERADLAPLDMNVAAYPRAWAALEILNRELGRNTLAHLGAFRHAGDMATVAEVLEQCGIDGLYRPIVSRWLEALAEEGTLRSVSGTFTAQRALAPADPAPHWERVTALLRDNQPLLAYLHNCAALLADVVAGRASPLETLFPGGSAELATSLYEQSSVMRYVNGIAAAAVEAFIRAAGPKRKLRVLEFGGGTGGTTSSMLRVMPAERTQYDFTDVSDLFLGAAAARFAAWPFLRTGLFDLERDPAQQGFAAGSYDIVLGANVLHAARDLRAAIARVHSLLAPGGMLLLVESTGHLAWHDFSTGLIEGWQHFTDDLRTDTPLLSAARWVELLSDAGFEGVTAAPRADSPANVLKQHVIVAWRAADAAVPEVSMRELPGTLQRVAVPATTVDVADSELIRKLRDALPSEREEIAAGAVRDCVVEVLHLDAARPPAKDARLMDLGVDSLLAVRLRNVLQKRLGLPRKLPATLIFDHPTVARIATLIVDSFVESQPAESSASQTPAVDKRAAELAALTDAEAEALLISRLEAEGLA